MSNNIDSLKEELLNARKRNEQAEVILLNLLRLRKVGEDRFSIPNEDVVISIQSAIDLIKT